MTYKEKWALTLALALLALCFVGIANAQTANRSLNIKWTLPTAAIDGSPLAGAQGLTSVQVFLSTATIPTNSAMIPTFTLPAGAVTTTQTFSVPAGGTIFVRLKACSAAGCSDFSGEANKTFPAVAPLPPTNLTVEITLTGLLSQPSISAEQQLARANHTLRARQAPFSGPE